MTTKPSTTPTTNDPVEMRVDIDEACDNARAITAARDMARTIGFGEPDEFLVATVVSELATNIFRYAGSGAITLRCIHGEDNIGIEIIATDSGPGIADIDQAMQDHFSTNNSLGLGLPSVKRIMDEFSITSQLGRGTTCRVRKWLDARHATY